MLNNSLYSTHQHVPAAGFQTLTLRYKPVLRILRLDKELFPGFGSGIIVPDPDPARNERADK